MTSELDDAVPRPVHHWGRWIGAVLALLVLALVLYIFFSSPKIHWSQIPHYLFNTQILLGLWMTVKLTVLCMVVGIILGTLAALMRLSGNPVLRVLSGLYIWVFRGTPQLVQILFWYNLGLFLPKIGIGSWSVPTNQVITSFFAAFLALSLNEGAYMAEIVRAGILAVPHGQVSAGKALGLRPRQITANIVLPQAMKVIIPPTANQLNSLLKSTSLVSVIAARDLLNASQTIYEQTFYVMELLMVACIWYLVLTTLVTLLQRYLERKLGAPPVTRIRRTGLMVMLRKAV